MTQDEIQQYLHTYFEIDEPGTVSINEGVVNVTGSVSCKLYINRIPVPFGSVKGSFDCSGNVLVTLENSPRIVRGDYNIKDNSITNLKGAPQQIYGHFTLDYNYQLSSLQGLPKLITGSIVMDYIKNLPLLPLLSVRELRAVNFVLGNSWTNDDLSDILNRYLGKGTRGMLSCAMEMIKAGYGSNARL